MESFWQQIETDYTTDDISRAMDSATAGATEDILSAMPTDAWR